MLFLELILNFLMPKILHVTLESFVQNSSGERERNDYFIITVMQQLMDKGSCCAMFLADTEQNCDPAPESFQSKYKAKGSS